MHKPKRFLTLPEPITEAQAEVYRSKEWQKIIRRRGYSPPRQFVQRRRFKAKDELKVIAEEKKEEVGQGTLKKEPEAVASSSKDSGGSGGHFVPPGPWTTEKEVEVDKEVVKLFKKPEVPPTKPWNPGTKTIEEIGTERDCRSVRKPNGFVITSLASAGFEEQSPLKPIPMVSPKKGRYEKLRHPRWELQPRQFYKVKLGMIKDPKDFYLEMVSLVEPPKDKCQSWEECLNHFYNQPGVAEQYKMRSLYPFQGQQYAVYTPELKMWERVRILAFHFPEGPLISGLYLDRNEPFFRVPFTSLNLHELHPYYARWPKYPVHAGLLDIRPVNHYLQNNYPFLWPKESIEYFKQMVQDKELWCWIEDIGFDKVDGKKYGSKVSKEDMNAMASVILFDKEDRLLPINVWLVLRALASGIRSFADARLTAYHLLGLERYLKEVEISKQFWQTVEKEPEEEGVKVGWIKGRDETELEEMFGKGAGQPFWVNRELL